MSNLTFTRQSQHPVNEHSVTVEEFLLSISRSPSPKTRRREHFKPKPSNRKKASLKFSHSLSQDDDDQCYQPNGNATQNARQQKVAYLRRSRSRPPKSILSFHPILPTSHSQASRPLRLDSPFLASLNLSASGPVHGNMGEHSRKRLISGGTVGSDQVPKRESGREVQSTNKRPAKLSKSAQQHPGRDGLDFVSRKEHEDAFNRLKNVFNTKTLESSEYQLYVKQVPGCFGF